MGFHPQLFDSLDNDGWAMCDDAIPTDWHQSLLQNSQALWQAGLFTPAGIGRNASHIKNAAIRGDCIHWVDTAQPGYAAHPFFLWTEQLRSALNQRYFLGLRSAEFHFTLYPPGQRYLKHLDQHQSNKHRKISMVLYLNADWSADDGGELCLFGPDDEALPIKRILPKTGRLVVFRSDLIPHEVLPATRDRWSLSGWLRTDEPL